jgi:hypothetical protein
MSISLLISNNEPYNVFDTHTGQIVYASTYGRRVLVRAKAERLNKEYGSFRYSTRFLRQEQIISVAKQATKDWLKDRQ